MAIKGLVYDSALVSIEGLSEETKLFLIESSSNPRQDLNILFA